MGSTKIEQPSAPAAPSTADAVNAWVASMPTVYNTQLQYAPLEAAQQVALMQQYALPYAQALKAAQDALYPETAKIQEEMSQQALEGTTAPLTAAEQKLYRDRFTSELGTNIGSPVGADYVSQGLVNATQQRQDYYRNLALSLSGRQPLTQAGQVATSNYMGGFTPQSVMNYTQQGYGNYSGLYGSMYGTNASALASKNQMMGQIIGSTMGGIGAAGGMAGFIKSAKRFKENIQSWE